MGAPTTPKRLVLDATRLALRNPPAPFLTWSEAAIKVELRNRGFTIDDPANPVLRVRDIDGDRFEQEQPV